MVSSPVSRMLRSSVLTVVARWYASRALVRVGMCSRNSVACFENSSTDSRYAAMAPGTRSAVTLLSFFHIWFSFVLGFAHRGLSTHYQLELPRGQRHLPLWTALSAVFTSYS